MNVYKFFLKVFNELYFLIRIYFFNYKLNLYLLNSIIYIRIIGNVLYSYMYVIVYKNMWVFIC